MTINTFLWGVACVVGISVGQILFKLASRTFEVSIGFGWILKSVCNYYLMLGLFVYAITTVLWVGLLKVVDLKQAYPLMSLAFLIVPVLARIFLQEKIEINTIVGGLIIVSGVYVSIR